MSVQGERNLQQVLLVDTCGERGSIALFRGEQLVEEIVLAERTASTGLLGAVRGLLAGHGVSVLELDGIGVVSGPGSFTGLRVGLAMVKGLCEATDAPAAAVSRLAVLAFAGEDEDAISVLRAGRDEVYVRVQMPGESPRETLMQAERFRALASGKRVIYAESSLEALLVEAGDVRRIELSARNAFPLVQDRLHRGGDDLASLDANYVRDEESIYTRPKLTV